jgi:anti-sigma B factor antagonist
MSPVEQSLDKLLVAVHNSTGYVHVQGRGSFKVSTALKQFGTAAIDNHCHRIILDMAECIGMDSTFMGVLAGLAFHIRKTSGGEIILINLSQRTRGLLGTLGLDQIIKPYMAGSVPDELKKEAELVDRMYALETGEPTNRSTAETMLEAHETLIELSPDNLPKFKDVLTFLRQDLKKMDSNNQGGS